MNGRIVKIGLHAIIWAFFLTLPLFVYPALSKLFAYDICHIVNFLLISAMLVLFFYFNYYFAIPRYYFKQKHGAFVALHFVFLMGVFITIIFTNAIIGPCVNPEREASLSTLMKITLPRHIIVFIASLLMRINERLKSIDAQKIKIELQLLRAQVNPHFLFNVLNTIYGQAIIKSENTADSIAKLSDLMRYSLEEANVPMVTLDKEITYLESYVSLQKLRLTNKTTVEVQFERRMGTLQIPPMLFIPFIENAFKYGVSNEVESRIKIMIKVVDKQIILLVENTKLPTRANMEVSNQIGIKNVKNRLDLIYGNRYTLDISDDTTDYRVHLKIPT